MSKKQSFGCQMWDAAFAIQAIFASGLTQEYAPTLNKAHDFVKASQVTFNYYFFMRATYISP